MSLFGGNPIIRREIDHRMRDNRTYAVPAVYVLVLGLAVLGAYLLTANLGDAVYMPVQGWRIGQAIFSVVAFTQMVLVLLLVPAVSAGAITAERDKSTLVALLVSPLPRRHLVVGKLTAPVLYVLLLISTSVPFAALSFGFGGTGPDLLLATYACLLSTVIFTSALGLAVSTVMRRTVPAVLLAYGLLAAVVVGSGIAEVFLHVLDDSLEGIYFVYLNPFTPLVLNLVDDLQGATEVGLHWWITPLLQIGLAALLTAFAARRIAGMRE